MQLILLGCFTVAVREPEPNHYGLDAGVWEGYEAMGIYSTH